MSYMKLAAEKGLSVCINSTKLENHDGCTAIHTVIAVKDPVSGREIVSQKFYPLKTDKIAEFNHVYQLAMNDGIRGFLGDVEWNPVAAPVAPPVTVIETAPVAPVAPAAPAAPVETVEAPAPATVPAPTTPRRGRPPKAAPVAAPVTETVTAPVEPPVKPATRKEPKPSANIVRYQMGDKVCAAHLGTVCTELYGAEFKADAALMEAIRAIRNELIGVPCAADGVTTAEFKSAVAAAIEAARAGAEGGDDDLC